MSRRRTSARSPTCSSRPGRAEELRDLALRAANVTGYRQILVLGSQAAHGALPDADLPAITTLSEEADLAVVGDLSGETPHVIEAAFSRGLPVSPELRCARRCIALSEVTWPDGWQGRVRTQPIDDSTDLDNPATLLSPEIHDLCAAKLTVAVTGGFGARAASSIGSLQTTERPGQ